MDRDATDGAFAGVDRQVSTQAATPAQEATGATTPAAVATPAHAAAAHAATSTRAHALATHAASTGKAGHAAIVHASTINAVPAPPVVPHVSLAHQIQEFALNWEPVLMIVFFTIIIFVLWRT